MGMGRKERGGCTPKPPIGSSQKQFVGWIPPSPSPWGQQGAFVSSPHANEETKLGAAPQGCSHQVWGGLGLVWVTRPLLGAQRVDLGCFGVPALPVTVQGGSGGFRAAYPLP